jgi:hypothetical protein
MNVSEKSAELLDSRLKALYLLHQDIEICFFATAKMHSNNYSLKKTIWYSVMSFAVLQRLLETTTI